MAQPLEFLDAGCPPLERRQLFGKAHDGVAEEESRVFSQFLSPTAAFLEMTVSLFFLGQHESVRLVLWTLSSLLARKSYRAALALTGAKFQFVGGACQSVETPEKNPL